MRKNLFWLIAVVAVTFLGLATPVVAQSDDFCKGLEAKLFSPENPLPVSAPCGTDVSRFTLVEPWRAGCEGSSTDVDCNVGFRLTDSWDRIVKWLADNKYDRGSVWANPLVVVAPAGLTTDGSQPSTDGQPATNPPVVFGDAGAIAWLCLKGALWLLAVALIVGLIIWLVSRRNRATRTATPATATATTTTTGTGTP